jgi:hypothetical protein
MPGGNGPTKVTIDVTELGSGWIHIGPGKVAPTLENLPVYLDRALRDWLANHPAAVVRTVLPLTAAGTTIGIHVWFDEPPADDVP